MSLLYIPVNGLDIEGRLRGSAQGSKGLEKRNQNIFEKGVDKSPRLCYNIRVAKRHAVLAQLDRVPGYEPVGRGFESLTPCQQKDPMPRHWVFLLALSLGREDPFKLQDINRSLIGSAHRARRAA